MGGADTIGSFCLVGAALEWINRRFDWTGGKSRKGCRIYEDSGFTCTFR